TRKHSAPDIRPYFCSNVIQPIRYTPSSTLFPYTTLFRSPPDPEPEGHAPVRLPPGDPLRLPLPDAHGVRGDVREALWPVGQGRPGSLSPGARAGRHPVRGGSPRAAALEGDAAADGPGSSPGGGSGAAHPRRTDERARSRRAQGGEGPPHRGALPGTDDLLLHAHPQRRGDPL